MQLLEQNLLQAANGISDGAAFSQDDRP